MLPRRLRLRDRWHGPGGICELLALAWPLIVSNSFFTFQIAIDRALLSGYSSEAVGAAMAAVLLFWTPFALLQFTANYVTVFVSQYVGAERPHRVGPAVGQSLYFSLFAGLLFLAIIWPAAGPLAALGGHDAAVQVHEVTYLRCLAFAGLPMLVTASASSFFTGRGDSRTVLVINAAGFTVNAILDFAWIGGHWGFPAWGIAGAGWATVAGSAVSALLALALMLRPRYRLRFATHHLWRFEPALFRRLLRFGIPNGIMVALDGLAFTLFTFLVGRLGPVELAATSIAFTLNAVAFLPALGVAQAVEVFVGRRLGEERPDVAERSAVGGLLVVGSYMAGAAALYVAVPGLLIRPFAGDEANWPQIAAMVAVLLRFVAVYSLFDGINVVYSFALRGAGDTRFTAWVAFALAWPLMVLPSYGIYWLATAESAALSPGLAALRARLVEGAGGGLYAMWAFASLYILGLAGVFWLRFRHGKWKTMRVIEAVPTAEPEPEDVPAEAAV
jgi:MATE family multidrug resistance protein